MNYASSYDNGLSPFQPDLKRGTWSRPHDLFYAGVSQAFRLDAFSIAWYYVSDSSHVVASLPYYVLILLCYIIPLMVMQMFLGQFSSSGFITAFRLSPIFKGIGYLSLALNVCVLCYFTMFVTVPLVYLVASLNPTLPWSCEGYKTWSHLIHEIDEINLCETKKGVNETVLKTPADGLSEVSSANETFVNHHIPSVIYFTISLFPGGNLFTDEDLEFTMSWQLILATIFVWLMVALFYYKSQTIELYGCFVRYGMWILFFMMVVCVIRFSFLEGAGTAYRTLFKIDTSALIGGLTMAPLYTLTAFGPGWGIFISLSSHNAFKTNIFRYSWCIGLGQIFVFIFLNIIVVLTEHHFGAITEYNYYSTIDYHWIVYLSAGSAIANMSLANFWCLFYYAMLVLAAFMLMICQVYSILTSVFDEFETLRDRKLEIGLGLILGVAVCSLYFASNDGILYFSALNSDAANTQIILNLLLILILLWIYGHQRFQRDIKFMVGQGFLSINVNILRFLVPLGLLLILLLYVMISAFEHSLSTWVMNCIGIFMILLPWLFIPGFMAYSLWRVTGGSFRARFRKSCRPTDWYPVASQHRQDYEVAMGNQDITHQLEEVTDNTQIS